MKGLQVYNDDFSGVLKDWQRYKQLETEKRADNEAERIALMKKLSLNCMTDAEEQERKKKEQNEDGIEDIDEVRFLNPFPSYSGKLHLELKNI